LPISLPRPGNGTTHAILHRVEVQIEFLGRHLVARTAAQENAQRLTQSRVVLIVAREVTKHLGHPCTGIGNVSAQQPRNRPDRLPQSLSAPACPTVM
jgi:hypothetical protein